MYRNVMPTPPAARPAGIRTARRVVRGHGRRARRTRDAACRQRSEQYSASGRSPSGIGREQWAHFSGGRSPARPERSRSRARDAACRQTFEQYLASLRASGPITRPAALTHAGRRHRRDLRFRGRVARRVARRVAAPWRWRAFAGSGDEHLVELLVATCARTHHLSPGDVPNDDSDHRGCPRNSAYRAQIGAASSSAAIPHRSSTAPAHVRRRPQA